MKIFQSVLLFLTAFCVLVSVVQTNVLLSIYGALLAIVCLLTAIALQLILALPAKAQG